MKIKTFILVYTMSIFLFLTGCKNNNASFVSGEHYALGTINTIKILSPSADKIIKGSFNLIDSIESKMSKTLKTSEVAQINEMAGIEPVTVSTETFFVIRKGLEISSLGDGAFDITIGPVVSLWGIGTDHARVPQTPELKKVLNLVNYKDVVLNEKDSSVYLKRKGMSIDLGGIAKGWASDSVYKYCTQHGVTKGIINLGGNVFVIGKKSETSEWHVGIQNPEESRGNYLGILSVSNKAVVTSGKYERFFIENGKRYHHIFNTFTGYPVENGLISVTIISRDSTTADGYSTLIFALGLKKGMALVEETPFLDAVIITGEHKIYLSSGIKKKFTLSNKKYQVAQ